jgi:hypothetical protein
LNDTGLNTLLEEEEEEEEDEEEAGDARDEGSSEESEESTDGDGREEATEATEELASEFSAVDEVTVVAEADRVITDTAPVATEPDQEVTAKTESGIPVDITDGGISVVNQPIAFTASGVSSSRNSPSETMRFDDAGGLAGFQAAGTDLQVVTYNIGTATNRNAGFDPITEVKWGRWSEGIAEVHAGADTSQLDLSETSLPWIVAPIEDLPAQEITGFADYVLVGNTDPTDNLGHVGVLGNASLAANFTNSTVSSSLQLGIDNQVWTATGSGDINARFFSGLYSTVTVDGSGNGSGAFSGMFTNFSGTDTPLGAGLTYDLSNGSTNINGAAVFNRSGNPLLLLDTSQ